MELSKATLEHLRDEAYVLLCRETVQENLKGIEQEKAGLASSRPPFGLLGGRKSRAAFEAAQRRTEDTVAALQARLARVQKYETWLHRCISRDLAAFLESDNPEYQRVTEILRRLDEWERCVGRLLPDMLLAYAREMRGLRAIMASQGRTEPPGEHEIALLRDISERLEAQQDYLSRMGAEVHALALEIGLADVRVPPLPPFRRRIWVESLIALAPPLVIAEVNRAETEVRGFLADTQPIIGRLQASRVSCAQRHENYLQQYWDQLRTHAQAHWVEEREVDEVLDTLAARYDGDIARHQRDVSHNPFHPER